MDILELIERLDDLVHDAKLVPLTDQVRVEREAVYGLLDEIRASIPEEVKQARWIVKERQEMLAEVQRECDRLLSEAREQAAHETSASAVTRIAERQAAELLEEARRTARGLQLAVEDWADGILSMLERNLDKFLAAVQRGRERLAERSSEEAIPITAREEQATGEHGYQ